MIQNFLILYEDKLIYNKFSVDLDNDHIIVKSLNINNPIIKVPIYNKYNGLDYVPIAFPLEMPIINNNIFNPYIILSSYNLSIDNNLDFFSNLKNIIFSNYNLSFFNFDSMNEFISFINDYYSKNITMDNLNNNLSLDDFIRVFWLNINIIKTTIIYKLINGKIKKKIKSITNFMQSFQYKLLPNISNNLMTFNEYYNFNYSKPLPNEYVKLDNEYFIVLTNDNKIYNNKIIKSNIKSIDENTINIFNSDKPYNNDSLKQYAFYFYHPSIQIDKLTVIYQTYLNNMFTNQIIKLLLNIDDTHSQKILQYFEKNQSINNLISLSIIYNDLKKYLDDISILNSKLYSNDYFKYITKKNITSEDKFLKILSI